MKTFNYGVAVTHSGKRCIWGNGTNYFGDFEKKNAENIAKEFNALTKIGGTVFQKSVNAKAVKVFHGKTYNVLEKSGRKTLKIVKRKHAG